MLWRYASFPIIFKNYVKLRKNWKLFNFEFWYIVFVECIHYSGLVIIDNDFVSLCNNESGFSKAVLVGLT